MEIRDPIHGFIHLTDAEKSIIDSEPFQRLRNIKQLGMSYYVYPGATHTRFEHSLGCLYVADRIFETLIKKHSKILEIIFEGTKEINVIERLKKTVRLAALLHDIGHSPFSHATEEIFPEGLNHERMSSKIIEEKLEHIFEKDEIKRSGIRKEDIMYLIYPEYRYDISEKDEISFKILQQIISGDIDADRIYYLTRDSYHAGVIYGRFDYIRLMDTLAIVPYIGQSYEEKVGLDFLPEYPEFRIGVEFGGLHTVEGLLLARYFMFLQVYFHSVRRIYDLMLTDFLKYTLPNGKYPEDVGEYLRYDDIEIIKILREEKKNGISESKILAERILERNHPKKIFESTKGILYLDDFGKEVKDELSKKFDLDPEIDIYVDDTRKSTYKRTEEDFYVVKEEVIEDVVNYRKISAVDELMKKEKIVPISICSSLLNKGLPDIEIVRVYAFVDKGEIGKAEEICWNIYRVLESEER